MLQPVKFYKSLSLLSLFRHSHFVRNIFVSSYSQLEFENNCLLETLNFSSGTNARKIKLRDEENSIHFHRFAILLLAIKEFIQQKLNQREKSPTDQL